MKKIIASLLATIMVFEMSVPPIVMALENDDTSILDVVIAQVEGENVSFEDGDIIIEQFEEETKFEEELNLIEDDVDLSSLETSLNVDEELFDSGFDTIVPSTYLLDEAENKMSTFTINSETSGTSNDGLTWSFDESSGTLTISGSGDMYSYTFSTVPWYDYKSLITSIIIVNGVTSIGNYAFRECTSLNSISIPNSVTSVGDYAFSRCISLSSVIIPDSVTSIGDWAFSECSTLTSITLSDSITEIGLATFSNCEKLTSVYIGSGVESVGYNAFSDNDNLESVKIYSNYSIYSSSWSGDTGVFADCPKLISAGPIGSGTNIEFNWTDEIPKEVFKSCRSLISVTIPSSIKSISDSAFYDCSGLINISIPSGVESIGRVAFRGCSDLLTVDIPNTIVDIDEMAFHSCSSLDSVTIPSSIVSLSSSVFYDCINLVSVSIPSSVTSIGSSAFLGCTNLEEIDIPTSVNTIGYGAFKDCESLLSISLPEGIGTINSQTFYGCSSLNNISLPTSLTSIEQYAFSGCNSLVSIIVPNGTTSLGNSVFSGCDALATVELPDTLTSIGNNAFLYCESLESITIPESVAKIDYGAFNRCSNLKYINLPNKLTIISQWLFMDCNSLTLIVIPDSVTTINASAFSGCSSLNSITIPNSVTSIEQNTFGDCISLKSVYLPSSIKYVGAYAFYNCSSLTDVYYGGSKSEWENISISVLNNALTNATIHYNYDADATPDHIYNGQVYYLREYVESLGQVFFDTSTGGYEIDASADTTNWSSYVGKYVIVEFGETFGSSEIAVLTPLDISNIGIVSNRTTDSVTINGNTYTHDFFVGASFNTIILYHILNGEMVSYTTLWEVTGKLESFTTSEIVVDEKSYLMSITDVWQINALSEYIGYEFIFLTDGVSAFSLDYLTQYRTTVVGTVTSIDYLGTPTIYIDNVGYTIGETSISGISLQDKVFCLVEENTLLHMDLLSNINVEPIIEATIGDTMYYYSDSNTYLPNSTTLSFVASFTTDYDFSNIIGYDQSVILADDYFNSSLNITGIGLQFPTASNYLTTTQDTIYLSNGLNMGGTYKDEFVIMPATGYVPDNTEQFLTAKVSILAEATLGLADYSIASDSVSVKIIDKIQYDDEEEKRRVEEQEALEEAERIANLNAANQELYEQIDFLNSSQIVLDQNLRNLIKDSDICESVSSMLLLWISVISCDVENTLSTEIANFISENLKDAYLEEMKSFWGDYFKDAYDLSKDFKDFFGLGVRNIEGAELYLDIPVNGEVKTLKFTYSGKCYSLEDVDFASTGNVYWELQDPDPEMALSSTMGTCSTVSTNANGFVKSVYVVAEKIIVYSIEEVLKDYSSIVGSTLESISNTIFSRIGVRFVEESTFEIVSKLIVKNVSIKCPVDVYIYDLNGNLSGSIINNIAYDLGDSNVSLSVDGDEKYITISDDYNLILVGTDDGTMEYIVEEVTLDGEVLRTVTFENVPLTADIEYQAKVHKGVYLDVENYYLTKSDNSQIESTSDDYIPYVSNYTPLPTPQVDNFNVEFNNNKFTTQAEFSSVNGDVESAIVVYSTLTEGEIRDLTNSNDIWIDTFDLPNSMKNTTVYVATIVTDELGMQEISDILQINTGDNSSQGDTDYIETKDITDTTLFGDNNKINKLTIPTTVNVTKADSTKNEINVLSDAVLSSSYTAQAVLGSFTLTGSSNDAKSKGITVTMDSNCGYSHFAVVHYDNSGNYKTTYRTFSTNPFTFYPESFSSFYVVGLSYTYSPTTPSTPSLGNSSSYVSANTYTTGSISIPSVGYISEFRNVLLGELINLDKIDVNGMEILGWYYDPEFTQPVENTSMFVVTQEVLDNGLYPKFANIVSETLIDGSVNAGYVDTSTNTNTSIVPTSVPSTIKKLLSKLF